MTFAELFGHMLEHIEVGRVATVGMVFPHRHTGSSVLERYRWKMTYFLHRELQQGNSRDPDIQIDIAGESSLRRNTERQSGISWYCR